ncbi:MAG: hypothetical protein FRX48_07079 [Lasallia pustulata]|uniref:Uncharacterized protein n=1 Tax=Lasallia pustulata TaxID=136370 RepID=A0A5M8PIR0_9LECA|nr:MAG: hypothetical protein FRX48_07079 [Lasallia pustulata]
MLDITGSADSERSAHDDSLATILQGKGWMLKRRKDEFNKSNERTYIWRTFVREVDDGEPRELNSVVASMAALGNNLAVHPRHRWDSAGGRISAIRRKQPNLTPQPGFNSRSSGSVARNVSQSGRNYPMDIWGGAFRLGGGLHFQW